MANFSLNQSVSGLGTTTIAIPAAGTYAVDCKISLPMISAGSSASSSVVCVINQNGSPVYTGQAGAEGAFVSIPFTASGTITVVLSSANIVDQGLNVVKSTIAVSGGN